MQSYFNARSITGGGQTDGRTAAAGLAFGQPFPGGWGSVQSGFPQLPILAGNAPASSSMVKKDGFSTRLCYSRDRLNSPLCTGISRSKKGEEENENIVWTGSAIYGQLSVGLHYSHYRASHCHCFVPAWKDVCDSRKTHSSSKNDFLAWSLL